MRTMGISMVAAAAFLSAVAVASSQAPDATLEFEEGAVQAGFGYGWGSGTLTYAGKPHAVSISGLGVRNPATNIGAKGTVYNLKKLEDINGNYVAVQSGGATAQADGVTTVQNQHGVKIVLSSTTPGVKFYVGEVGAKIALK